MVTKTFECPVCQKVQDIEMDMNEKAAECPDCHVQMTRIFNMAIARPGADNKGFYGIDKDNK